MLRKNLAKILFSLLGPSERFSLEHRIFNALICSIWIINAVAAVGNYYVGLPVVTIIVAAAAVVFYSLLYYLSRFRGYFRSLTWPVAISTLLVLSFIWVNNGGSSGSIHLFLVIAPLIAIFLNTNPERFVFIALYVSVTVILLIVEYMQPSFIHGKLPRPTQFADMLVSTIEVQLVIAVTFVWAVRQYRNMLARVEGLRRKSEAKFSEVADQLPAIICEFDPDQKITYANRMTFQLTGFTPEDLVRGMCLRDIIQGDEMAGIRENMALLRSGSDLPLMEYHLITKDKKVLTLLAKSTMNAADGRDAGYRMYMIDVTEQKKLEDHFRQTQKMESIGQLAGGVAHDFNNILTGILGPAYLIDHSLCGPSPIDAKEIKELIGPIIVSANRAADLVKNLLVFSRFNTSTGIVFDLNESIDEAIRLLAHSIDKKIEIIRNRPPRQLPVKGDRTLIESAIINLAVNSRDAMPDGGVLTIASSAFRVDMPFMLAHPEARPGGDYAKIRISDTGTGMDDRVRQHLFEPFFTTKGPGKGTGLGLARVYGTVKTHGGIVDVVSQAGKGTAFTLFFPLCADIIKSEEPSEVFPSANGTLVLLIDDEEVVLKVEELTLRKQGYAVKPFADPVAAVDFYRNHAAEVGCVILDMVMPRINGRECYAQLHSINPSVKVIVTSGFVNDAEFEKFVAGNNLLFVAKPFSSTGIIEALHRILT